MHFFLSFHSHYFISPVFLFKISDTIGDGSRSGANRSIFIPCGISTRFGIYPLATVCYFNWSGTIIGKGRCTHATVCRDFYLVQVGFVPRDVCFLTCHQCHGKSKNIVYKRLHDFSQRYKFR